MSRLPLLAALFFLLLSSCAKPTLEQAVFDDFQLFFLSPEKWDVELNEVREDRLQEKITYLRQVEIKVREEHMLYAKRCNPITETNSSNCQSAEDLNKVLIAMSEVELGLREGTLLKDSLSERLNYGLSEARIENRTRLAQRVKKHFLPPPPPK